MHDTSKCLFDFSIVPPGERIVDFFGELGAFDEFVEATDDEIKIAICTSDIDSPFVKISDRETMLNSVYEFLKLPKDESFEQILKYKHARVSGCVARYFQLQHHIDWTEYCTNKQTFDYLVLEANKPITDEDKDIYLKKRVQIQKDIKAIGAELKVIEAKIFPDSKIARQVAMHELKKIKTYAEKFAQPRSVI